MNLADRKVWLTGGSGFLGRVIKRKLEERGAEVLAPRSHKINLLFDGDAEFFIESSKPDVIIHSAAYYGGLGINGKFPADIFYHNTIMYARLLDAASKFRGKIDKIIMVGTACSYPDGLDILNEKDLWSGPVHKSVQNYGAVKKMMQIGLESYKKQYDMDGIHVLLANLYGEHDSYNPDRSHVAAALIRKVYEAKRDNGKVKCWGTGIPIREFLYVEDAAEGIVRATEGYTDIEPLNIGTGIGTSIKDLVEKIAFLSSFSLDNIEWDTSQPDGQFQKIFDVSKMKQVLKWQPPTSLESGLSKTINWFNENYEAAIDRW